MYDYVDGKVDWMAFNLPAEGEAGPFIGSALIDVPTCGPHDRPGDVLAQLGSDDADRVVVVTDERVVVGTLAVERLRTLEPDGDLIDAMDLSPATIRPSVEISVLNDEAASVLVTTPHGVLLGAPDPSVVATHEHVHEHRHVDDDEVEQELSDVMAAIHERFGDEEPDSDELRQFLRDRLVEQGRTPEQADEILAAQDQPTAD